MTGNTVSGNRAESQRGGLTRERFGRECAVIRNAMPTASRIVRTSVDEHENELAALVDGVAQAIVAKVGRRAAAAFAEIDYLPCRKEGVRGCGDAKMVVMRYRDRLVAAMTVTRTDANHVEISFVADDLSGVAAPENPEASA